MTDIDSDVIVAFGHRLTEVRVRLNITQDTLAELADLDRSYISLLERGERNPSLVCLVILARALNVNIARLCYFVDNENRLRGDSSERTTARISRRHEVRAARLKLGGIEQRVSIRGPGRRSIDEQIYAMIVIVFDAASQPFDNALTEFCSWLSSGKLRHCPTGR